PGDLASEILTMPSTSNRPVQLPRTVLRCGNSNEGVDQHESGLVGLRGGPLSFISQLGSQIGGKFSSCMIPEEPNTAASSKVNFSSLGCCSGMVATPDTLSIYGNLAQTNFLVGYDTVARTITFKPIDCTTQ
ncbi:hypothetical protein IFM89_011546, partial [Coptis chinensis]